MLTLIQPLKELTMAYFRSRRRIRRRRLRGRTRAFSRRIGYRF